MPATCPACGSDVVLGSLRCARCGGDARGAETGAPRLSLADAIGHDLEASAATVMGAAWLRRQKIIDRLEELSPAFLAWARLAPTGRGPCPALPPEHGAEVDAMLAEYARLRELPAGAGIPE